MKITVKALANVIGLVKGDVVQIEVGQLVDSMIEAELLAWMDPPVPTFEQYEVTDVVKARVAGESAPDLGAEAELSFEPASPEDVWVDEGGYPGESD